MKLRTLTLMIAVAACAFGMLAGCSDRKDEEAGTPGSAQPEVSPQADPLAGSTLRLVDEKVAGGTSNAKRCNIERIGDSPLGGGRLAVSRSQDLQFAGWVVDEAAGNVPRSVVFRLQSVDGKLAAEQDVSEWSDRPDVSKHYGKDAYLHSGFTASVKAPALPAGRYGAFLAYPTASGTAYCGLGTQFELRD
jgi:hypothetical protein